jgi:hypothetical protein
MQDSGDTLLALGWINLMTAMALVPATAYPYHSNLNLHLPLSCKVFLYRIPHSDISYPAGSF